MFTLTPPDLGVLDWNAQDSQRQRREFGDRFHGAAEDIAARIREAAPKRSGALAGSVRVERHGDRVAIKAGGVPETTKRGKSGIFDYAVAVEHGTGLMTGEPFFYPAARGGKPEFDRAAEDALDKSRE